MAKTIDSTPKKDGYRMPGEYEHHKGCWMLWPERTDTWRNGGKPAQQAFIEVAKAISRFEPVTVGVNAGQYDNARTLLPDNVRVVEISQNDSWMRDMGPTFVVNGKGDVRGVDWDFNAYGGFNGGLYFPWDQDRKIRRKVMEIENVDRYRVPLILEGGAIHVDGEGTLLTTKECLLNENRNPHLTKENIEEYLTQYLNLKKIIWFPRGIILDETDGHVDDLVCFVRPGEILLTWTDDESDPQYEISKEALEILENSTDAKGRKFKIHKLYQPGPLYMTREESEGIDYDEDAEPRNEGDRLAGSYINFYIANGGVVVPLFDDKHDQLAMELLTKVFPDRKVVGVPGREILLGGGCVHCITQQQPSGIKYQ